jgi:dolichol-phosphate mannosyltransferase
LVAVCTYNERENIAELLDRIRSAAPEADLLVVDDNSPDGTGRWVQEQAAADPRIRVIIRPGKQGLGTAIVAAMDHAIAGRYRWLVNLDADLSHDPADIPRLLAACREPLEPLGRVSDTLVRTPDVVIGSRYVRGGQIVGWPRRRRWMSRTMNALTRVLLRIPVEDASGSFRSYRVAALDELPRNQLRAHGYALLEELLWHLHRQGCRFHEVPIVFTERRHGRSKLSWHEAIGALQVLIRLGCRTVFGRQRSAP